MQHIFFDLDGTLTDPFVGITTCMQEALRTLGETVPSKEALSWCIGPPLRDNFVQLVGEEVADQGVALYRSRFNEVGWRENEVYEGIENCLQQLLGDNKKLYVASSKPHIFVDRILQHFELAQYFSAIYGSELDGTRANKAQLLEFALRQQQLDGADCVMVGDRKHDCIGANHNRMKTVGVLWGYGSKEELSAHTPNIVADIPNLPAYLN